MIERTVDEAGRIILPKKFREKYGITEGLKIIFDEENGKIIVNSSVECNE